MANIGKILEGLGIDPNSVARVRLGQGVVGKATYAVAALFIVLAIIAYRIDPEPQYMLPLAVLAAIVFVFFLRSVLSYAHNNPGPSLLEGAELLQWQQSDNAARGLPTITLDRRKASLPATTPESNEAEE